jgi:oxygen-dependent protoporphyrinogen oxidase
MSNPRCIIIGGGITGLAAAYRMQSMAPDVQTVLIDGDTRLGGKIRTDRSEGFVVEGGPDSFLTSKPRGIGLCRDRGIERDLQGTRDETRRTYVKWDGRLHPMPEGLTGLVPARLEPLLHSNLFSSGGKERLSREPEIPSRPDLGEESLAAFVARRFGREVYDRLVEPLMAGIYAGNGEELSLQATFPQLRQLELEHGSLIRGLAAARPSLSAPRPGFVAPVMGMREMVAAVIAGLTSTRVVTGSRVRRVSTQGSRFVVFAEGAESLSAQAIILAAPGHATADILSEVAPTTAAELAQIPYVSSATVALAYSEHVLPPPVEGHGYVIPRAEGGAALACTFASQKFAHRAPPGHALFRVFIGRAGGVDPTSYDDDQLVALARRELSATLDIDSTPRRQWISRWPRAMPQYVIGHIDRLRRIEDDLRCHPGLILAGAYKGVGIPDCIASGERAADAAIAYMRNAGQKSIEAHPTQA